MSLNTTSFFNSNEVHISSRMNEYMKKNFGYEVEGDIDTLREAKKSLEAEQIELKKHSYMNHKYMENMLMIETINSLVKAHSNTPIIKEDDKELEYGDTEEEMAKGLGMSQDDFWELAERVGQEQYGSLTKDNYEDVMNHIVDNADSYTQIKEDSEDDEEQHRRDVKHGLYGDDEEESQSEDEKAEHDRDVKRGLYGEDSSEPAFSIRTFKNAKDPSKDGLEITKTGGMGGTVIIKNQKELKDLLVALKGNVDNLKEAYNPETGRDPNVDTTEWDDLIAKTKKKQEKEYANSKEGKRDPAYRHYHQYKTQEAVTEDDETIDYSNPDKFELPEFMWKFQEKLVKFAAGTFGVHATKDSSGITGMTISTKETTPYILNTTGQEGTREDFKNTDEWQEWLDYQAKIEAEQNKARELIAKVKETTKEQAVKQTESVTEDDEEKGPEHYRWKNESQLAVALGRIESAMEEIDHAIEYRGENSAKFFNNGDKAGVGSLMSIKGTLQKILDNWEKDTEFYGM